MQPFQIERIEDLKVRLSTIDPDRLNRVRDSDYRPGELNLLNGRKKVSDILDGAKEAINELDGDFIDYIIELSERFYQILQELSFISDGEYISRKHELKELYEEYYIPIAKLLPEIESAKRRARLESKAEAVLDESEQSLENVRETAKGVSIREAQKEFEDAAALHNTKALQWGVGAVVIFVAFGIFVAHFMSKTTPNDLKLVTIYFMGLRTIALATLLSLGAVCISMTRGHLHLVEQNLHRKRLANCVGAFVAAAIEDHQKDLILGQLVDSIASFGATGLVNEKGPQSSPSQSVQHLIQSYGQKPPAA